MQPKQPPQDSRSRSGKAALALCLAAAGAAHAENSVTIYGILDNGIEFINNQPSGSHSVTRMTSGGQAGSRWGFRGNEDLGGGSSAFFVLESGLSMDSGSLQQGGRLFGRLAYVGIETPYGLVSSAAIAMPSSTWQFHSTRWSTTCTQSSGRIRKWAAVSTMPCGTPRKPAR